MPKKLIWLSVPAQRSCLRHRLMPGSITRTTRIIHGREAGPSINKQVTQRVTERQEFFCAKPGCARSGTTVAYRESAAI